MVKQFTNFFGYDLKRGTQIVAIVSGVISLLLAYALIHAAIEGGRFVEEAQEKNPRIKDYGGSRAFLYGMILPGVVNAVHFFICIILWFGAKCDGATFVRCWLRSTIVWLCFHIILIPIASVVLFAAGVPGEAIGILIALVLLFVLEVYFLLIVNSYYNTVSSFSFWEVPYGASTTPTTCQVIPQVVNNRPTVLIVN